LFVNGVEKTVAENSSLATSHEEMVLDVSDGGCEVERRQVKRNANALTKGVEGSKAEFKSQVRLAEENKNETRGGVHLGVEQEAKLVEEVRRELVGFINDEQGAATLTVSVVEGIMELGEHSAEIKSGFNLKAKQDLAIKGSGLEMRIGEINDGKEMAVEGVGEGPQCSGFTNTDIASDQSR